MSVIRREFTGSPSAVRDLPAGLSCSQDPDDSRRVKASHTLNPFATGNADGMIRELLANQLSEQQSDDSNANGALRICVTGPSTLPSGRTRPHPEN